MCAVRRGRLVGRVAGDLTVHELNKKICLFDHEHDSKESSVVLERE
jgi:hypothetical protein